LQQIPFPLADRRAEEYFRFNLLDPALVEYISLALFIGGGTHPATMIKAAKVSARRSPFLSVISVVGGKAKRIPDLYASLSVAAKNLDGGYYRSYVILRA
jgi:hypothetical protein